jgi:hypothetical protein
MKYDLYSIQLVLNFVWAAFVVSVSFEVEVNVPKDVCIV